MMRTPSYSMMSHLRATRTLLAPTSFRVSNQRTNALLLHTSRSAASSARPSPWGTCATAGSAIVLLALVLTKPKIQLDATTILPTSTKADLPDSFCVDPATSMSLPLTISLSRDSGTTMQLVGLGVRTVSFLRVKVYVAGLYVDSVALEGNGLLRNLPGWTAFRRKEGSLSEDLVREMLEAGVPCVIRIVPVRQTDFGHLRDGFVRALQARLKALRKSSQGSLSDAADEALSQSIIDLKAIFPKASLPKGSALDLLFIPQKGGGGVDISLRYEDSILGTVQAPKDAGAHSPGTELLLAYLADKDEISKPLKQSVTEGFHRVFA